MPIQFCCFISYRHSPVDSGANYARDFVAGFKEELGRWVDYPVSFDEDRLEPGDFVDESLAADLYASSCMVVLYNPNYFSRVNMFCSREYFGMLELEKQRIPSLRGQSQHGLVIPIALRGHSTMVKHVRMAEEQWCVRNGLPVRNRLGLNFDEFSRKRQLLPGGKLNGQLQRICRVIRDRQTAFEGLVQSGTDPFLAGATWRLPPEHEISSWVNGLLGFTVPPQLPSQAA
jgi:hypothetical protein